MRDGNNQLGLRGKATLLLGGLIFLALAITSYISYMQSTQLVKQKVMELEKSELSILQHEIKGSLSNHHKNILTLQDVPSVQAILRAHANNGRDPQSGDSLETLNYRLQTIFTAFLSTHPEYFQIRYIDLAGNETIRVEKNEHGAPIVTSNAALQNKAESSYVTETLKLKAGQAYYSDVTLNREHGIIQEPHQPTLRIAIPIFNASQQISGLIVINLSTKLLFSNIKSSDNGIKRAIVNEQGFYIKHDDSNKTFGFELGSKHRLQNDEPEMYNISMHQDQLIRFHAKHVELDGFQKIYFSPSDHSRYWLLVLKVPEKVLLEAANQSLNQMLRINLLIGISSLLLIILFVSKRILTPLVNLAKAANRLQAGELSTRLNASSVHDEFNTLYSTINAFAENQQQATNQLESKVNQQTKRLSAVIDNVVDGIITIGERGEIESFNPAARKIFGYSDAEVIGQNVKMLMPEPYHSEHDGYLDHHINTGEKKVIGIGREVTGQRKDGSTFPMELAVSEVIIDNVRHFVGITRDITERKRIEQMQKEFVSTVSHELRTPLTSIRGSLGLILGGVTGELPEKAKALLTIANNNSERLIHLINDILDMEKITAGKMQFDYTVVNLTSVVQQAVESNKGYGDQLHVRFELISAPDEAVMVKVDEKRMAQVMSNLLSNAAKYSPTDDTVEISIEASEKSVRITVHDNGKGIPEEFKSRIFSKFAQADSSDTRQKGGTGLGLNITKEIVEQQGGAIGFESEAGRGTTFYVDLPIWSETAKVEKPEQKNNVDKPNPDKPLVLIVEDDKDVSKLLSMMLEKEGYNFHQAFDYEDAVNQIAKHKYDAITLDLMIPGGSGISLLRQLRNNEATSHLPVIVVSAKAGEGEQEVEGDSLEVVDWIEKPVDEKRLMSSLRSGLTQALVTGTRILHVEDDNDVAQIIDSLTGEDYQVTHATTLAQAKQLVSDESFDLVLLDIGLPDGSGLDLLPMLHSDERQIPVIVFSAMDVSEDIITQVDSILIKSKTDNQRLMQQIKAAINKKQTKKGE